MFSNVATAVTAAIVGGAVAAIAAFGIVQSQESAGSEINKSVVTYDG